MSESFGMTLGDSFKRLAPAAAALAVLATGVSCGEQSVEQPASLQTPRAFELARGPVCMSSTELSPGVIRARISACPDGERGAIGLIANQTGNSVSVVDMSRGGGSEGELPRLVDLDPSIPGVTGIPVGNAPTDIAAGDATTAYVINQADASITVLDLWNLQALPETIDFGSAPKHAVLAPAPVASDADADPDAEADTQDAAPSLLAVTLTNPPRLWLHPALECKCPEDDDPNTDPIADCTPETAVCPAVPAQADGVEIPLPATSADMVAGPAGNLIYVIYTDAPFASVVAVRDRALADFPDGCLDGGAAPCEVDRIGLTFDCSNGVDDDGDGQIDQADAQCYGPRGFESPEGIGRSPLGACSNGLDDDADGAIDRADPACLISGGDDEIEPLVEDALFACMDEEDNDRDGAVDFPADAACYGATGRSEDDVTPLGFTSIGIDPFGKFLYVVDRANDQVIVVDAVHRALIDVYDASGRDRTAFAGQLGVAIPPAPTVVDGRVDRDVVWEDPRLDQCDPDGDCRHAIVRYNYGAFVATDGGFAYNLNALTTFCEVTAPAGEGLIAADEFFFGSQALQGSAEQNCLTIPDFPLAYDVQACEALESCAACRAGAQSCDPICEDTAQLREDCFGERLATGEGVRLAFNAAMQLQDSNSRASRVRGLGSCDTPESFTQALRASTEGLVDTSCTSLLRPQPVRAGTSDEELTAGDFQRAGLLQGSTLLLAAGDQLSSSEQEAREEPVEPFEVIAMSVLSPEDQAIVSESWTVTWEGVIPGTRRDDGLLAADQPGLMQVAGIDLCVEGVQEGDRLTILSAPIAAGEGELPEACRVFVDGEDRVGFLTWSIIEVRPNELVLEVIAEEGDAQAFVNELPTRECFAQGVDYEIRAHDEWIVVGDRSGFLSDRTSVLNTCRPVYGADRPRFDARVQTGEFFQGPYLSFLMREGAVPPSRDDDQELSYRFGVERNFRPDAFRTTTLLPTRLLVADQLNGGPWLIIADPASDFVFFSDLSRPSDEGAFLMQ
jgi:hypothetical protein